MKSIYTIFNRHAVVKNTFFVFMALFAFPLSAQQNVSQGRAREFVLQGKIQEAIVGYAQLAKASDNTAVLMEYAYTLARGSMFEVALMHLDRAKLLGAGNEYYFYAAQVLALMGHESLAVAFRKIGNNAVPVWLRTASLPLPRQSSSISINHDDADTTYIRANMLAVKGMFLQSVVLLQELIDEYPTVYFPYLSASIAMENLNLLDKAAELLEKSITLINEMLEYKKDEELKDALPAFNDHLNRLKQQATLQSNQSTFEKLKEKFHPQTMLYAGGMYSNSFFSLNSRFGVFIADSWNAAADLGIAGGSGSTYVNLGLSVYDRWKFLVAGLGFSGQFGESSSFNLRGTFGLSFFNKRKSRSFDVFFTYDAPLVEGAKTIYGISIGRSFYFGKRKGK
jgi:tetratricopeptide (TPR) repeat protein